MEEGKRRMETRARNSNSAQFLQNARKQITGKSCRFENRDSTMSGSACRLFAIHRPTARDGGSVFVD